MRVKVHEFSDRISPRRLFVLACSLALTGIVASSCTPSAAGSASLVREAQAATQTRYAREIARDLDQMLTLLEAQEYDLFLGEFMDPRVVARLDSHTRGDFKREFAQSALAHELHAAIRSAAQGEPTFGKDVDVATFEQPEAGRRLLLRRMDGRWRVLD